MNWLVLVLAGLFEIGWPVGLKIAQAPESRWTGVAIAIVCMFISATMPWMAQRTTPIGTAYAVWTGIGAAGTLEAVAIAVKNVSGRRRWTKLGEWLAGKVAGTGTL